jgi:asparagine synthase (glutamine-hydrolysing)
LWRSKEAFSDGVTSIKKSLFHILHEIIEEKVQNEDLKTADEIYPHCPPKTKEAYYYR